MREIIKKIQSYIETEEEYRSRDLLPTKAEKTSIEKLDLDDIFGQKESEKLEYEMKGRIFNELEFWRKEKQTFIDILKGNKISNEEFRVLKDAMNIIRGKYFMDDTYETIDKDFQDMCSLFIKFQLQQNDLGINNFLRYIDPNSAYYKRVKALTLFRLLNNPRSEIKSVCSNVCGLLYESIEIEPDSIDKCTNILKEYFERVFTIACTSYDQRIDFISQDSINLNTCLGIQGFSDWLWNYIKGEEIEINNTYVLSEDDSINESDEIKDLKLNIAKQEEENTKLKKELEATWEAYNEDLKKKEQENIELRTKLELMYKINEQNIIKHKNEKSEPDTKETIKEKRKYYRITVVGGSDKANKKYNQLLKIGFKGKLYENFGIKPEQLGELYGDYNKQKTQKDFAKNIENELLSGKTDFVIALQTDHETGFYKLLNNNEFGSRITYFSEREENNQNPKYTDQSFSEERFYYYLNRALEKYERAEENSIS